MMTHGVFHWKALEGPEKFNHETFRATITSYQPRIIFSLLIDLWEPIGYTNLNNI